MDSHPNYELLQRIGQGEFASVYRARDLALKRFVAIKVLHERFRADPRQLEQFWEEAQFLANLQQDNIVQIYGLDQERGWIIMELMRGSLDAKLDEGPLSPDLVRSVMRQTLEALQFLHEQDILHGAVKPANLLINDQGRVKLSDSSGVSAGAEIRKPTGTPKYLAPELLNPQFGPVGPGVDLYGLGFTALELLKGRGFEALFKGAGAQGVDPSLAWLRWHSSAAERLPPVRELVPGVPEDLAAVIDRLLVKEVAGRPRDAAEALKQLVERPILLVDPPKAPAEAADPPKPRSDRKAVVMVGGEPPSIEPENAEPKSPRTEPRSASREPSEGGRSGSDPMARRPPKPWSQEWLNEKLKDPKILYPVLAAIIIPTALLLFMPTEQEGGDRDGDKPIQVAQADGKVTPKTGPKPGPRTKLKTASESGGTENSRKDAASGAGVQKKASSDSDPEVKKAPQESKADPAPETQEKADPAPGDRERSAPESDRRPVDQGPPRDEGRPQQRPEERPQQRPEERPVEPASPPPLKPVQPLRTVDMTLALIRPGTFRMGSPEGEGAPNEHPAHDVAITRPFYLGLTEVTQGQYRQVMGSNPSYFSPSGPGAAKVANVDTDALPVERVSYKEAKEFCRRLAQKEGLPEGSIRLPTEAEWEYAARAGGPGPSTDLAASAWFSDNAAGRTHPVGTKQPNAFGLHDMAGNVYEWCEDWYRDTYSTTPREDPQGPDSPESDARKVVRGGCWISGARLCRPTDRNGAPPDDQLNLYGFRVVLEADAAAQLAAQAR